MDSTIARIQRDAEAKVKCEDPDCEGCRDGRKAMAEGLAAAKPLMIAKLIHGAQEWRQRKLMWAWRTLHDLVLLVADLIVIGGAL